MRTMPRDIKQDNASLDRRTLLRAVAAAAVAAPMGVFGAQAFPFRSAAPGIDFSQFPICKTSSDAPPLTGAPRKLKLSWNAGAVCLAPLPVAIDHGFFQKQNLDVELVNYSGSTDQLLEAIATGKTDAGLGMALRWLKPLEQGFDVKIAAGTHGGCMRVLSRTNSGVDKLADLKGKIVGVGDLGRSRQEFLLDPARQTGHRSQQGSRLARLSRQSAAARCRQGRGAGVPRLGSDRLSLAEGQRLQGSRFQSGRRLQGQELLHRRIARLPRARGAAGRPRHHAGVARCAMFTSQNPEQAAESFQPYAPKSASLEDLQAMVRYHTHHHHPVGAVLKQELKAYADDLKLVSVFKPRYQYGKIRGAHLCRRIRRLGPSRSRNRSRRARRLPGVRCCFRRRISRRRRPACSPAWHG